MEQVLHPAFERIDNPILSILLIILVAACSGLWVENRGLRSQLLQALLQNITAMSNVNGTLSNMKERLDNIEDHFSQNK